MAALVCFLGLLLLTISASAQEAGQTRRRGSRIIDDSTKQVYGPRTSKYYFERDVYLNRLKLHEIDTAIRDFQRFTYVQRGENKYQDLGNIGSAIRPIYFQMPELIGATSGFTSYDLYWNVEQMRMYDTKSPYANMHVMLGGKGRSMTRVRFSRNITPRWNFGFTYRALLIDKQVQRQSKGDRSVRSTYYDLFTSYMSKDSSYRLIASFRRNNLDADEYGGIRTTTPANTEFTYKDYYSTNAQPNLLDAAHNDLRMNIRIYQQYEVAKALQIYNTFERYRQGTEFTDRPDQAPDSTYDYIDETIRTDTTIGLSKFRSIRDEVGIKGNLSKLFYQGYYMARWWDNYSLYTDTETDWKLENYIGGRMSLRLDSLGELSGWAELQLDNGNYRIEGELKSKWFEASLKQMQYAVPIVYQNYRGQHDLWSNNFSAINATQLQGFIHYNSRVLSVSPGVTLTGASKYVFMKYLKDHPEGDTTTQTVFPVQTADEVLIASPELKFSLTMLKHVHLRSDIIYTVFKNDDDAIQIPKVFVNAQLAYENIHYNGNLDIHTGFEFHYQSTYNALAYDIPMQLYYVAVDDPKIKPVEAYPLIDVFVSAKIKRAKIFFKYNNILQAFTQEGYMPTWGYPGQRNILDFGFDWSFYD